MRYITPTRYKRSLTLKLILAFLMVSLLGAILMALFARLRTASEFDRFVANQALENFVNDVAFYYDQHGEWTGVERDMRRRFSLFPTPQHHPRFPNEPPFHPPPSARPLPPYLLLDNDGRIVIDSGHYQKGDILPAEEKGYSVPVLVEGQQVGEVVNVERDFLWSPLQRQYINRINASLLEAAIGATILSLLAGMFLARTLTRPLRELTDATEAMSGGDLHQQVPVRSQDELGQLAISFNQMSAELVRANQLRRQMTADIAHDLRNPLMILTGYLESLRDGVLEANPTMFEVMHEEAQHLQRLVEDLRTLSLADAGELSLRCEETEVQPFLEKLATSYMHQAAQQKVNLSLDIEPNLPPLQLDTKRMAQVIGNLVSNALRYTPTDGLIVLTAYRKADQINLGVHDTGIGIPADKLPHIFERFYRVDEAREQNEGESGLGLAIARSIVEAHGGTIVAGSQVGLGTTFTIALPIQLKNYLPDHRNDD